MFGFLTSVRPQLADRLANVAALEAFWRTLPHDNVVAAQEAICTMLVDPVPHAGLNGDRLRALLLLDRYAQPIIDALLADLVTASPPAPLGPRPWQGAFELCRALGQALGRFLRAAGEGHGIRGWREHLPFLLLRILERRRVEMLLRPYVDDRGTRFSWKDLHDVYRVAESCNLLRYEMPIKRSLSVIDTTIDLEYINILLQGVLQGGNFPPRDASWLHENLPRWCRSLVMVAPERRRAEHRFVVDLDGDVGLTRVDRVASKNCLGLDPGPLLRSLHDEVAALRSGHVPQDGSAMRPATQQQVLGKVESLFATVRPVIRRRGEREPVALRVEVVVGVTQIARALRSNANAHTAAIQTSGAFVDTPADGSTIGGNTIRARTVDGRSVGVETTSPSNDGRIVRFQLTMVDRSESGCRLHGAASAETPLLPGVLFAFRMDPALPWTIAVVRRVKKRLGGKRVEIGAEYLGSDPRRVVVVIPDTEKTPPRPPGVELPRFAAIYLPESTRPPVVPFRTLILPSRGLAPDNLLSLRFRTDNCTIRLGQPLEEQMGFVWSPFEILERWSTEALSEPTAAAA